MIFMVNDQAFLMHANAGLEDLAWKHFKNYQLLQRSDWLSVISLLFIRDE